MVLMTVGQGNDRHLVISLARAGHHPHMAFRIREGKISAMTRSDLIAVLASRFPSLVAKDAEVAVKEILETIGNALAQGDRVEIRGFGSFRLNYRQARTGRNPKSGETVAVTAKYVPHFQPGKEMRERVEQSVKSAPLQRAA
jgi:integration host factor subunit beta